MSDLWDIEKAKEYLEKGDHIFSIRYFLGGSIAEVERLLYENDNFAYENHSLTGDVSAIRERGKVLTKERDEFKAKLELTEKYYPLPHEKIKKLETENAELRQDKEMLLTKDMNWLSRNVQQDEEIESLKTELESLKLFTADIVSDYKKLGGKLT